MVVLEKEPPIPNKSPATGRIAMGSIKDRPTRCNTPKKLFFISVTSFAQYFSLISMDISLLLYPFTKPFDIYVFFPHNEYSNTYSAW